MSSFLEYIRKTQHKEELTKEEIQDLIELYTQDKIPDYQMSAWTMAAYINGLSKDETFALATAIRNSGKVLEWNAQDLGVEASHISDKHSTGGVGDKVSLILVPLAVHLGLKVPMMSGRSLGHTGGTVDKLQSIEGFDMFLNQEQMLKGMKKVGASMICQSEELCPADKRLYALRDVTSTVDNVPLITASIVSKKWAEGVGSLVFDVKFGSGAFMDTLERARELAASLVDVSKKIGIKAAALITRMEEPLGAMIGNSVEVLESCWILSNSYPDKKTKELCQPLALLSAQLAAKMACLAGTRENWEEATAEAMEYLESGKGFEVFHEMCLEQGASEDWKEKLKVAPLELSLLSPQSGFIHNIDSKQFGLAGLEIAMGRKTKTDKIDHGVGFQMFTSVGNKVEKDQALMKVFVNNENQFILIKEKLLSAFSFSDKEGDKLKPLLEETLEL